MLAKRRHQPPDVSPSADLTAREKDLGQALAWIRQEMIQMKEQDKSLLKQFIDLRASILQLRCLYHYHGSTSDVNSLQGSTMSLNEARKSPRLLHIARADSDMAVATSSLKATSLPNSPQLFRFKWRSDELM
nr:hypothetical protein BaRGS_034961 [Batillaria attramentaria]